MRQRGKIVIDDFDRRVIRDTIQEFYVVRKIVPTISKLIIVLREKIDWKWSKTSLKRLLKDMGFVWKKCQSKRLVLIERADIVSWRCKYLTAVTRLRSEGREVFYLDESWVDSNLTFEKCWQKKNDVKGLVKGNASKRLIIVHIGSKNGFLEGGLLLYKAGTTTGDYHGEMNSINFEKWISEMVIPNLPPNSVVIMDNAPYHTKQEDKPPSKYEVKREMIAWLRRKGVACDEHMTKTVLIDLIEINKPREKVFRVDKLMQLHGHHVVRSPPYMCEFNAIELAWAKVKRLIRENNTTGEFSLEALQQQTKEAISAVTKEDWAGYCRHVETLEKQYVENDRLMELVVDDMVIRLGDDSDSEDEDDQFASESDDGISSEDGSESSCLAEPLEPF